MRNHSLVFFKLLVKRLGLSKKFCFVRANCHSPLQWNQKLLIIRVINFVKL